MLNVYYMTVRVEKQLGVPLAWLYTTFRRRRRQALPTSELFSDQQCVYNIR